MGLLQDYLMRLKEKKMQKEEFERGQHIQEGYYERKKSGNERLLEKYQEEERQKRIKQMVEAYKKRENAKVWSGRDRNAIYAHNMMVNQKKLFTGEATLTKAPCLFGNTQGTSAKKSRRKRRK